MVYYRLKHTVVEEKYIARSGCLNVTYSRFRTDNFLMTCGQVSASPHQKLKHVEINILENVEMKIRIFLIQLPNYQAHNLGI